jgi:uncharacterized protein YecE (DUF72 family)
MVTHEKMLKNCEQEVERFFGNMSLLGDRFGPLLLQFPPSFGREHLQDLSDFLTSLQKSYRAVVEVGNKTFLEESLYSLLRDRNTALATVEGPFVPKVDVRTADFAYIRWEEIEGRSMACLDELSGRNKGDQTLGRQINRMQQMDVSVFGYFSKYYSGHPPTDVRQLLQC